MGLADRGGSSGFVGARWAEICAAWVAGTPGRTLPLELVHGGAIEIERAVRLDDDPRVAFEASRQGKQNPDFVFVGRFDGRRVAQAADAKFSIETARSKQVSPEVLTNLLTIGPVIEGLLADVPKDVEALPGFFISPDFPLTRAMLQGRHGIMRATVRRQDVVLISTTSDELFGPVEGSILMPILAAVDGLAVSSRDELLAGLYYFRLARACIGCWLDAVRPLLAMRDVVTVVEAVVQDEAARRAKESRNAFELVLDWDADVEAVRRDRAAVEQVAGLPVLTRDLRAAIATAARGGTGDPPSVNQVRRKLGAWYRAELRREIGPLAPPVIDLPRAIDRIEEVARRVAPGIPAMITQVTREIMATRAEESTGAEASDVDSEVQQPA